VDTAGSLSNNNLARRSAWKPRADLHTGLKDVNREIIGALRELKEDMAEVHSGGIQTAPRARPPAPARQRPAQPKSPALGLFGF
jgi:hypothetical protein